MCPIPQGTPSLSSILTMISLCPCPYVKKDVKLSKRCQAVKKMSSCQKDVKKSNTWTMEEVQKKKIDIMRFTHFDVTYDGDQKPSKCA